MSDTATQTGNEGDQGQEGQEGKAEGTQTAGSQDAGRAGGDDKLRADLADERKARQAEAKRAKDLQEKLDALEAESKTETEKAIDKARQEGRDEALKAANLRVARMAIRAEAITRFADPTDSDIIDASQIAVDEHGNVDTKAVRAEIDRVLKEKPHWAKQDQRHGSADQGARGAKAKSTDMNDVIRRQAGY